MNIMQPNNDSEYSNILNHQGEGIRILVATPRTKSKLKNDEDFRIKGFSKTNISENKTLYVHPKMPFQIQINY